MKYQAPCIGQLRAESPPTRGRELKFHGRDARPQGRHVAPHAGAGIEMSIISIDCRSLRSPPTRGRELKFCISPPPGKSPLVAPHAGAGIEIKTPLFL